jgi:hypothetical protein
METMAAEQVLDVVMRRHVIDSDRPFDQVLAGIFGGISQPDIAQLFGELEASGTYQQFSSLVEQAQGSAGLMRFWQLDLDNALTLDPEAPDWTGQGLDKRELRQAGDVVDLDCPPFFIDRVEDAVPSGPKAPAQMTRKIARMALATLDHPAAIPRIIPRPTTPNAR